MKTVNKIVTREELSKLASKSASGYISDFDYGVDYGRAPIFEKLSNDEAFDIYRVNQWVGACVSATVRDCTQYKWRIVPRPEVKSNASVKARIQEITRFLRKPNENKQSFRYIRRTYLTDKLVFGYGAIEKVVSSSSRKLKELHPIQARHLRYNVDNNGNLKDKPYIYLPQDKMGKTSKRRFNIDEIMMCVDIPCSESMYGVKRLDNLVNTVASDIFRDTYNTNFFVNGGEPSGIIFLEGAGRTDLKAFENSWRSKFRGAKNAHKVAVTNTKANFVRVALSNRDMEFGEYGVELRRKIFAMFCMQPAILGIYDDKVNLDYKEQAKAYKRAAVEPQLSDEKELYDLEIIQEGFGYDDLEFEFIAGTLDDEKERAEVDQVHITNNVKTVNEVRESYGRTPVPWGDSPLNVLPGGNQIDPKTGRLIPPRDQSTRSGSGEKPTSKPTNPKKSTNIEFMKAVCEFYDEVVSADSLRYKFDDSYAELIEIVSNAKDDGAPLTRVIESLLEVFKYD